MQNNFPSNLAYREYLIANADSIIKSNQLASNANCTNTAIISDTSYTSSSPIMLSCNYSYRNNDNNNSSNSQDNDNKNYTNNFNKISYLKNLFIQSYMAAPTLKY